MDVGDTTFFTNAQWATSVATVYGITAFNVAQLNDDIVICANAEAAFTGGTLTSINITGYLTVT
jgi:hypothetical protein